MKNSYNYIISILSIIVLSTGLYAANTNTERLAKLRLLADYDLAFDTGITPDSIIVWEELLEPKLEMKQQYDLLFLFKMMATQSLITQGHISLAINNANLIYQKAKEMEHPLGTALALRAMGDTYLSSATPQASVKAYNEALEIIQKIPNANKYMQSTLSKLIIIKLNTNQLGDIVTDLERLEAACHKTPDSPSSFFLLYCKAFYYIKIHNLSKATEYMQPAQDYCKEHPYPYYKVIVALLYSRYHVETREYALALKEYDRLLQGIKHSGSYRYTKMLQERGKILSLMGNSMDACRTYDSINMYKDTLNAQSYTRQINELHTLYQIDQNEIANFSRLKQIFFWSIFIVLFMLLLIALLTFRIKQQNKRLFKSQQEQERAKKQAENSIRTKSLFLSNMSHEIRTPLNALSGFSSILAEDGVDSQTRQQCNEIILQNSTLLLKLIDDVIDLSSLEIGEMTFNLEVCDAVMICKNVIDMVEKIKQTNADVHFFTSLDSLKLTSDNTRLQQVLINLLINATKFTPQGAIALQLEQDKSIAIFSVTDTGCGIPKEKQPTIFNRFEKVNEDAQGTGIGLSICQIIIEHLGGKIWIDPNYTEGTRFIFTHPIQYIVQREELTQ